MAQIREDKKREILNSIEELAESGDILELREDEIVDKFTDSQYNAEKIEEIVRELEKEDTVVRKSVKFDLVYPTEYNDNITDRFSFFSNRSIFQVYFFGFITFGFLMQWGPISEFVLESTATNSQLQLFVNGAFFGIIGSYYLGVFVIESGQAIQNNVPIIREFRHLLYPVIGLGLITAIAVLTFRSATGQEIKITHIIMIVSVSIAGGIPIGKFILKENGVGEN